MNFNNVKFEAAFGTVSQLPQSTLPEVVFAGRSNVGKSSLINRLFGRKALAKVSQNPGKTATINFYLAEDGRNSVHFVDLPGYGYAKVSKAERARWGQLIEGYFAQERAFALVVCLVDIRHNAQALDENMIQFVQDCGLPFAVVLTKADKLSRNQQMKQAASLRKQFGLPKDVPFLVTSAEKGTGMSELKALIGERASAVS